VLVAFPDGHALRTAILGLLHERAATVTELAGAVGRPKGTVAYHVGVLEGAGLVRVVRTRRVRAIQERYFGRTARMFYIGFGQRQGGDDLPLDFNDFDVAAQESQRAFEAHNLRFFIRHARIPPDRASAFWARAMDLVQQFDRIPRAGKTAYGFVVGLYPPPTTRSCRMRTSPSSRDVRAWPQGSVPEAGANLAGDGR
jgi:DNA-binding transcriptional ArsR family regulator